MLDCYSATTPHEGYLVGSGGARIFYRVVGKGPDTIIAMHGGPGGDMENIAPDLVPLGTRHVVIYYDQRGGGRSELPADTTLLHVQYFIEDLEAVRRHFGLERINLLAHSFRTGVGRALRANPPPPRGSHDLHGCHWPQSW